MNSVEVELVRMEEPVWCIFCSRQAHYAVVFSFVCGRHLLKAVRAGTDGGQS